MKSILSVLALILVSTTSQVSQASLQEDFDALKDSGMSFVVTGSICEEVARLNLAEEYKEPQYQVVTGIAYGNSRKVIGELDVIVFENKTGDVVKIAEVKCWKDQAGGLTKALEQRKRFLKNVTKGGLYFQSTHDKRQYAQKHFRKVKDFETIGQFGAKDHGYDRELEHDLDQVMGLRTQIMQCQQTGECQRP